MRGVETGDHTAACRRREFGVRRHDACVHDVDDHAGAEGAAAILTVENAVALIDPVEVPEEIDGRGIAASIELGRVVIGVERDLGLVAARRNEILCSGSRGIDGERKQIIGERSSQQSHLNFRTSWTTSNKIRAKREKWQGKLLGVGGGLQRGSSSSRSSSGCSTRRTSLTEATSRALPRSTSSTTGSGSPTRPRTFLTHLNSTATGESAARSVRGRHFTTLRQAAWRGCWELAQAQTRVSVPHSACQEPTACRA